MTSDKKMFFCYRNMIFLIVHLNFSFKNVHIIKDTHMLDIFCTGIVMSIIVLIFVLQKVQIKSTNLGALVIC